MGKKNKEKYTAFSRSTFLSHSFFSHFLTYSRRKCITTIQGLPDDLDLKKIAKALKKTFQCNGTVNEDEELGEIIQLSGDQRTNVREFFVDQ